jgi:hypothetical protein
MDDEAIEITAPSRAGGQVPIAVVTIGLEGPLEIEQHANINLITAAPRLLSSLQGLLGEWEKLSRYGSPLAKLGNEAVRAAKEAIMDATGVQA